MSIAEWWTKTSAVPSSGAMKPKPLSGLNHFTVPCAICCLLQRRAYGPARVARAKLLVARHRRKESRSNGMTPTVENGRLHDRQRRQQLPIYSVLSRPGIPVPRALPVSGDLRAAGAHGQRLRRPRYPADRATAALPVAATAVAGASRTAAGAARTARPAGGPAMERSSAEPGLTLAVRGDTPAWRIRPRTSPACAGLCTVITTPAAPARAVRPDRCR